MSEPDFRPPRSLAHRRIAILGLGLMGGSLAMALQGRSAALLGADPDPEARAFAQAAGLLDQVAADPGDILPQADLVLLAAPVGAILEIIANLPKWHPGRAVVIDVGSTKTRIVQAMARLPERFDPLGGHPMCGKEQAGIRHAQPDLYQGAPFAFTPLARTSPGARELADNLARALGARPVWLEPEVHDRWTAATSHVPYLLAACLAAATPLDAAPLIGPGFHSTTRLASSSPSMMLDVLRTNRLSILAALQEVRACLDRVEDYLEGQEEDFLRDDLFAAAERHRQLLAGRAAGTAR